MAANGLKECAFDPFKIKYNHNLIFIINYLKSIEIKSFFEIRINHFEPYSLCGKQNHFSGLRNFFSYAITVSIFEKGINSACLTSNNITWR